MGQEKGGGVIVSDLGQETKVPGSACFTFVDDSTLGTKDLWRKSSWQPRAKLADIFQDLKGDGIGAFWKVERKKQKQLSADVSSGLWFQR